MCAALICYLDLELEFPVSFCHVKDVFFHFEVGFYIYRLYFPFRHHAEEQLATTLTA